MSKIGHKTLLLLQLSFVFIASLGYPIFKQYFVLLEVLKLPFYTSKVYSKISILYFVSLVILFPLYIPTIIYTLSSLSFAKNLSRMNLKFITGSLTILMLIYIIYLLFSALSGLNPNTLIGASRNHIAVPLIAIGSLRLFVINKFGLKDYQLIYIMIFFISVWSVSRGNIISSFALFIIALFSHNGEKKKFFLNLAVILFSAFFLFKNIDSVKGMTYEKSLTFSKFIDDRNSISKDPRREIIGSYIEGITFLTFFTGVNDHNDIHNNLHNSYLNAHSMFGVCSILFFAYTLRKLAFNTIYFLPILLRAFTDTILIFSGELDFIIFLAIIIILNEKSSKAISFRRSFVPTVEHV